MILPIAAAALVTGAVLVQGTLLLTAAVRRRGFYRSLGPVVRIATPCRIVSGPALLPGAVGLTPQGLFWRGIASVEGSVPFQEIARIETDARLMSGRALLRNEALRITRTSGEVIEFVLAKGPAWEWHRAIGEWVGAKGRVQTTPS